MNACTININYIGMILFDNYWNDCMEGGRRIDKDRPWQRFDGEAVWVDEVGNVNLGIKTSPKQVKYKGVTYDTKYAVGTIRSMESFGYGTFSADIMLPKGQNLWPSFWLVGEGTWPNNGEIDIMEAWSNSKGSYYRFPLGWRTTTNVHYLEGTHKQIGSKNVSILKQPRNPSEIFVRYEAEWRPNKITFRVNGKTIREIGWDVCRNFIDSRNMHVIFNLWTDSEDFTLEAPMVIKNFKYEHL